MHKKPAAVFSLKISQSQPLKIFCMYALDKFGKKIGKWNFTRVNVTSFKLLTKETLLILFITSTIPLSKRLTQQSTLELSLTQS